MHLIARRIKTLGEKKKTDDNNNNAITNYAGKAITSGAITTTRSLQR